MWKTTLFRTLNSASTRVESARVASTLFRAIVEPHLRAILRAPLGSPSPEDEMSHEVAGSGED